MVRLTKKLEKLRERTDEINVFDNRETIREVSDDMIEYLTRHPKFNALAAPMINRQIRMFAIRFADGIKFFINPIFTKQNDLHISIETNPCLDDRHFLVPRNDLVGVAYQDLLGTPGETDFTDTAGDLIQQMIQLLDGLWIDEIGMEVFDDFLSASDEDKQEVINLYLDSLKQRNTDINNEIEGNPELKEYKEGMDFLMAAARGDIQIESPKLSNRKQRKIDKFKKQLKNFGKRFTKKKRKK